MSAEPSSSYSPPNSRPALTLDLTGARPPPPHLVFHPPELESEPTSPTSRARTIRFHSRVRIASGRRSHSGSAGTSTPGGLRTRSASRESRVSTSSASTSDSDYDSDSSSVSAPLRDSRQRSAHDPPSPMPPPPPAQSESESEPQQTYIILGPTYGWSEHTPLLPKRFLQPQRPRGPSRRYDSQAELNAELERARAAAKRTEEDVRCSTMDRGWLSLQWWGWKLRREVCCCFLDDDDDDHDYD
ncbi:hypothetical protein EXIGLDRAFT_760212 [Exidia glandulosa HHB12029]|uniref:Uncharacterized protein n=1 Tax=Exidia glandulosa HHB12029 TaxID=1314781 RepID=A0A165PCP6_EXIGL|nr:hypothetical protein EXIGLDRAFT_760212 [Exidia glandulosa HHB12029]